MEKTALFGAAGAIGKTLADTLGQRGRECRVVGRDLARLEKTFARTSGSNAPNPEIVTWDPDDPASVRSAARGIDTLIYLVGVPYHRFDLHPVTMLARLGHEDEMRLACQVRVNGDCTIETTPAFNLSGENFWQKPYPNK